MSTMIKQYPITPLMLASMEGVECKEVPQETVKMFYIITVELMRACGFEVSNLGMPRIQMLEGCQPCYCKPAHTIFLPTEGWGCLDTVVIHEMTHALQDFPLDTLYYREDGSKMIGKYLSCWWEREAFTVQNLFNQIYTPKLKETRERIYANPKKKKGFLKIMAAYSKKAVYWDLAQIGWMMLDKEAYVKEVQDFYRWYLPFAERVDAKWKAWLKR